MPEADVRVHRSMARAAGAAGAARMTVGAIGAACRVGREAVRRGTRPTLAAVLAAALAASIGGCAYAPGLWLGRTAPERAEDRREADAIARAPTPPVPTGEAGTYRIGPGDAIRITVWNHPDLNLPPNLAVTPSTLTSGSAAVASNVVPYRVVNRDGSIYFPLAGRVQALGRTVPELRSQIARQLSRYVKDPQVEVEMAAYRSQRVFMV